MRVARVLYPVESLGPGKRIALWLQGCERKCPKCANPELWDMRKCADVPLDILVAMISSAIETYNLDGITITGGEPLLQAAELADMLDQIDELCDDVLLFTGYRYDEICRDEVFRILLPRISVLVDGPYIWELNRGETLRGSTNQNVLILDSKQEWRYREYMRRSRHQIDDFDGSAGIISVGIHPQGVVDDLKSNDKMP